ncbi:MAG: hypothetical protein KGK10_06470 [Rhodospirillales bacterium]|nr:hypothetical protein [Rhodospirillales bacterium]
MTAFYFMHSWLLRLTNDRRGITAIEYAVLALGIIPVVALAAAAMGASISSLFGPVTHLFTGGVPH